jgi:hypothetical protein
MSDHRPWQSRHGATPTAEFEAATPPRRPAPMPRQTLDFWTPRLAMAAMRVLLRGLRQAQPALQHAPVTVNVDEPR